MFINTSMPMAFWHGSTPTKVNHIGLDEKQAQILLYGGLAMSDSNGFGALGGGGLRPRQQGAVISDEPWFQNEDQGLPTLDGSYSDCLSGVNTLPTARHPNRPTYVSHDAPRSCDPSSQFFPSKRISEGDSFWASSPTDHSFASSANSPVNWNVFQGIPDPFGFNDHIHGLPGVSNPVPQFPGSTMTPSMLDYPIYSPSPICGSFSSTGAIDMMESMVLKDENTNHIWPTGMCDPGMPAPLFALDSPPWSANVKAEATVSPKQLRIHPTPTPASSCDSMNTSFFTGGDSESALVPVEQPLLAPPPQEAAKPARNTKKPNRKQLPDRPLNPRFVPILPSNSSQDRHPKSSRAGAAASSSSKTKSVRPRPPHQQEQQQQQRSPGTTAAQQSSSSDEKSLKDEFLVQSKLAGMTYKEIRRKGGFTEAESTLRGRFRTLTKNKEARVRKPEWAEIDDRLLKRAVRKLAKGDDLASAKIPWKQVAEYIVSHGGSYHFGNTTCRKRWDMLVAEERSGRRR